MGTKAAIDINLVEDFLSKNYAIYKAIISRLKKC